MKFSALLGAVTLAAPALAQHAQVSAVAVQPGNPNRVWVCNMDNGTVACIDVSTGVPVAEIPVGVHPRSLAFNASGSRLFVANQRGNVPISRNFVTPFTGTEQRGTVSVIDVGTLTLQSTLTNVGTEPYGVAVAPNGKYFAVSGYRSGTLKFYDAATLAELVALQLPRNLNQIAPGFSLADHDGNRDGIADLDNPRGFTIRADSLRLYVAHTKSPYVSLIDVTLDGAGLPTAASVFTKINLDDYAPDPVLNPVRVQNIQSQGIPRMLEDVALSPDGARALVPHLLHNVNHDVTHNFGPALPGDFANRVYPALTLIDTLANSYGQPGDTSKRLHHELADPAEPAQYVPFGRPRMMSTGNVAVLGGSGAPVTGGAATLVVDGMGPFDTATLLVGARTQNVVVQGVGISVVVPRYTLPVIGGQTTIALPANYTNTQFYVQALVHSGVTNENAYTNGVRIVVKPQGFGQNKLGYRAGHPHRVAWNSTGDRAVVLNRGSEDLFLYKVTGGNLELMSVFPPRVDFQPRAGLDTTTPMGDLPLGMVMVDDASTPDNEDALVFIVNEATRSLSSLRVDFTAGTIHKWKDQMKTHLGPDALTTSQRIGLEIFEDASRPQTAGNFNNSCSSCHFEGGDDGNVWQRPAGPRSTMPMYGGTLGTGMILWKGVRLNNGETGPMFGGENGGTGLFSDAEQQGLVDFHDILPIPLNPNLDPITGQYSATAAFGKDLYFGTNGTGLNPTGRHAGCAVCHPDVETNPLLNPGPRFYTADFVNPTLSGGEMLGTLDPDCFALRESLLTSNMRNVNTAANIDRDLDGFVDIDRNLDGFDDRETYVIMNTDKDDDFRRDDGNSYTCPCDPLNDPNCDVLNPFTLFTRAGTHFSVPTKLGIFASAPYFHDHAAYTLRALLDPEVQALSPVYGSPAFPAQPTFPGLNKLFNDAHDVRGHMQFVPNSSRVQITLNSGSPAQIDADIEALLAYIQSL